MRENGDSRKTSLLNEPLRTREVLCGTGHQVDLRALCRGRDELDQWSRRCREVLRIAIKDNKNPRFPGISSLLKPSDGLEPSTPSLPWRFRGVTRVHARSSATQFLLQIELILAGDMRREASRLSFLMCPFCVRAVLTSTTTARPLA